MWKRHRAIVLLLLATGLLGLSAAACGGNAATSNDGGGGPGPDGDGGPDAAEGVDDSGGGEGGDPTGQLCSPGCTKTMMCTAEGACVCAPGWQWDGAACVATPISNPATRTKEQVCARRAQDAMFSSPLWVAGSGGSCDPGTVPYAAQVSGLRWLNFWRWMLGLGPVQVMPEMAQGQQACAKILQSQFSHFPTPVAACYTQAGADACGASLIASGYSLISQIDAYAMEIDQNLLHRRHITEVGRGGAWLGASGGAANLHYGGDYYTLATDPPFVAHPGPGPNIRSMVPNLWFVQFGTASIPPLRARVFVVATNEEKPMSLLHHFNGFSSFGPSGWSPALDTPYRIELYDDANALFASYTTTFISCP